MDNRIDRCEWFALQRRHKDATLLGSGTPDAIIYIEVTQLLSIWSTDTLAPNQTLSIAFTG